MTRRQNYGYDLIQIQFSELTAERLSFTCREGSHQSRLLIFINNILISEICIYFPDPGRL